MRCPVQTSAGYYILRCVNSLSSSGHPAVQYLTVQFLRGAPHFYCPKDPITKSAHVYFGCGVKKKKKKQTVATETYKAEKIKEILQNVDLHKIKINRLNFISCTLLQV
jgi:hypothetical protein